MKVDFEHNNLGSHIDSLFFESDLSFGSKEQLFYKEINPSVQYYETSKNVKLVNILSSTPSRYSENLVALFPGEYVDISGRSCDTFFFINKFLSRFFKYTQPFIANQKVTNIFDALLGVDENLAVSAICNWVCLHERMHSKGSMPLDSYRNLKSKKYAAAFEELRVDLLSIDELLNTDSELSNVFAKYILAERLLSYPLHRDTRNSDAISSVYLHHLILKSGGYHKNFNIKELVSRSLIELEGIEKMVLNLYSETSDASLLNNVIKNILEGKDHYDSYRYFWRDA